MYQTKDKAWGQCGKTVEPTAFLPELFPCFSVQKYLWKGGALEAKSF